MPVSSTPVENVDMSQESVSVTAAPVTTVATLDGTDEASLAPSPDKTDSHEAKGSYTASTEHAKGDHGGGLPQMQTEHWAGQIVWLLIIFGVLFLLLGKMFAPRLRKVIDARSSTIAEDLANARAIRDEAEAQAKQASKMATDARSKAQAELTAAQAAEDIRLNALLAESEARIRGARDSALAHVSDIASETASALVEKLTGKPPTTAALKAALKKG
jgi:F-type H+-transporting ATPase subunit b